MMLAAAVVASLIGPLPPPSATPAAEEVITGLSAADIFALADRLALAGQLEEAEALLEGLARDPRKDYRLEAKFRLARLKSAGGDRNGAIALYRSILDERPEAASVRLELAQLLAEAGEDRGARRELQRAAATGLPPAVARNVDRVSAALRSTAPYGGSVEFGLAPDSNINRATADRFIDIGGFPFVLDEAGRARSGIGLSAASRAFARVPMDQSAAFLIEAAGNATVYSRPGFDDLSALISAGPQIRQGGLLYHLHGSAGRRTLGGRRLYDQAGIGVDLRVPVNEAAAARFSLSATRLFYQRRPDLDGMIYSGSAEMERALSPRAFASARISAARYDAGSAAQSTHSLGTSLLVARSLPGLTPFVRLGFSGTWGDAPFLLFGQTRRDRQTEIGGGVVVQAVRFEGFSPVLRFSRTRNASTLTLYDFTRTRAELGLSRSF